MPSPARPSPVRIVTALAVLALPTGWLARTGVPAWLGVPAALAILLVPLWHSFVRARDEGDPVPAVARAGVLFMAALGGCAAAGVGVGATGWVLAGLVAAIVLAGADGGRAHRPSPWLIGALVAVVAVVVWRPLEILLSSDAPAHVAAILDAARSGSLSPPDSFPGATGTDPRFGILHGFYAVVSGWTGASASEVLRRAALFFSPLWLLAHATLMHRLGLGARTALLAALLFTLHAGVGRAFGLGAAAFPGSVAQIACAFGLALLLRDGSRGLALASIALSALVHPFAWWSTTIVLFLAGLLMLDDRRRAQKWLIHAVVALGAGALLLVPRLAGRGASEGLHSQLHEVVFVGGGLFFADPFWVFRWGGLGSVLALPALLFLILLSRRWFRRPEHRVGVAIALPVWLISLNPLVAPLAWPMVSYLVVRLGRIVLTTWVWTSMLTEAGGRLRQGGRGLVAGLVLGGLGLWGIGQEVSSAWLHLRQPQVADGAGTPQRLDELAAALDGREIAWLLTDPRIGYGIRARGGPALVLTPVAHASPHDRFVLERLARWRQLHDPTLSNEELEARLKEFGDAALLVDTRTRALHDGVRPYAYLPDDGRSRALDARLRQLGLPVIVDGDGWAAFQLDGPAIVEGGGRTGASFRVAAAQLARVEARPGETVTLTLTLEATGEHSAVPRRVFVRLEGEMPGVPAFASGISKVWRKLFIERSGRSQGRFGQWVAPADLVTPPERWEEGVWRQEVQLRIPRWAEPGIYSVQVTTHEWTWHDSFELRDYLSDTDRYTAPPSAVLQVLP